MRIVSQLNHCLHLSGFMWTGSSTGSLKKCVHWGTLSNYKLKGSRVL